MIPEDIAKTWPDYPYLEKIRQDLWGANSIGRAAVMVGAGFSLNAIPIGGGTARLPLWNELIRKMRDAIGSADISGPLKTAQAYEATFGRNALDRLIAEVVPDLAFRPSELHHQLLRLPWADIFTTNYDTLLERAQACVHEVRYENVLAPADLPLKRQPRLVKLHGTLPSQRPFIITEEDYRSYPVRFAPFVNLVRESVMENTFVLLGFSGDDPNFLEWTGWVRDQLREHTPLIYLCGIFDLSPAQRHLIEQRRVVPVNFGPLFPVEQFPDRSHRHAAALRWFLAALSAGRPPRPVTWPGGPYSPDEPELKPAVPKSRHVFAACNITHAATGLNKEQMRELARAWKAQRADYPGWLVPPTRVRNSLWHLTNNLSASIFSGGKELPPVERLLLFHELNWRLEVCALPLFLNEVEEITKVLEAVNPFPVVLELKESTSTELPPDAADAWIELAFAVLREAREDLDEKRFALWLGRLTALSGVMPRIATRLLQEKAWFAVASLNLTALEQVLAEWRQSETTALGKARLAAIYAELLESEAAQALAQEALAETRLRLGVASPNVALLSQEAWISILVDAVHDPMRARRSEVLERWHQLRTQDCDAWEVIEDIRQGLKGPAPTEGGTEIITGFDPGRQTRRRSFGRHPKERLSPAFRALRVSEDAGCPLVTGHLDILADPARTAAVWIERAAPFWSVAILVRLHAEKGIEQLFARAAVAAMDDTHVDELWRRLLAAAEQALQRLRAETEGFEQSLAVRFFRAALEILSRLAFRFSAERLDVCAKLLVPILSTQGLLRRMDVTTEIRHFCERVIFAAEHPVLQTNLEPLLGVPILGEADFEAQHADEWPEPAHYLFGRDLKKLAPPDGKANALIHRLTQLVGSDRHSVRTRAFFRIQLLHEMGWLGPEQIAQYAAAIWRRVDDAGLPTGLGTTLAYLTKLPAKPGIEVPALVRARVTGMTPLEIKTGQDARRTVSTLSDSLRQLVSLTIVPELATGKRFIHFVLNAEEAAELVGRWLEWWRKSEAFLAHVSEHDSDEVAFLVETLGDFLGRCVLPRHDGTTEAGRRSVELIEEMQKDGYSTIPTFQGTIAAGTADHKEAARTLGAGLLSKNRDEFRKAVFVVNAWYLLSARKGIAAPPPLLIDRLVARVLTRATPELDVALGGLQTLVDHDVDALPRERWHEILEAMGLIAAETNPQAATFPSEREAAAKALDVRRRTARLARSLHDYFELKKWIIDPEIKTWADICRNDHLPEVRRAWTRSD